MTNRAKTAIQQSLREEDHKRYVQLKRKLARVAFENIRKKSTKKALHTTAKTLAIDNVNKLLTRLNSAKITDHNMVHAIYPKLAHITNNKVDQGRTIINLSANQVHKRKTCCQPIPSKHILSITFRKQGVTIHAINYTALVDYKKQPKH